MTSHDPVSTTACQPGYFNQAYPHTGVHYNAHDPRCAHTEKDWIPFSGLQHSSLRHKMYEAGTQAVTGAGIGGAVALGGAGASWAGKSLGLL